MKATLSRDDKEVFGISGEGLALQSAELTVQKMRQLIKDSEGATVIVLRLELGASDVNNAKQTIAAMRAAAAPAPTK